MLEEGQIKSVIIEAIPGAEVLVKSGDGVHFEAVVISTEFEGKSLVEQQRMVMLPLEKLFQSELHALGLKTYTPKSWEESGARRD